MEFFTSHLASLNPLTVAASAFATLLVGGLWISPLLFSRAWIRLSGIRPGDIRPADQRRNTLVRIATAIVTAALIGMIAEHAAYAVSRVVGAITLIWVFIMLQQLNGFLWRRDPFALFLLVTTRTLVSLLAGGLVFCFWR